MLALLTAAWAWALPWLGPIVARASILAAGARSALPVGGSVLGLAVAALLGALLVYRVGAWLDPPPRTFTAAEIEAASLLAENKALKAAVAQREQEVRRRDASIDRLATINQDMTTDLETARAKTRDPAAVLVPADDGWLREWHRRGW